MLDPEMLLEVSKAYGTGSPALDSGSNVDTSTNGVEIGDTSGWSAAVKRGRSLPGGAAFSESF